MDQVGSLWLAWPRYFTQHFYSLAISSSTGLTLSFQRDCLVQMEYLAQLTATFGSLSTYLVSVLELIKALLLQNWRSQPNRAAWIEIFPIRIRSDLLPLFWPVWSPWSPSSSSSAPLATKAWLCQVWIKPLYQPTFPQSSLSQILTLTRHSGLQSCSWALQRWSTSSLSQRFLSYKLIYSSAKKTIVGNGRASRTERVQVHSSLDLFSFCVSSLVVLRTPLLRRCLAWPWYVGQFPWSLPQWPLLLLSSSISTCTQSFRRTSIEYNLVN